MQKASSLILGAVCTVALVGCGGGSGSTFLGARNPHVRVIDTISNPDRVNVSVNGQPMITNGAYNSRADYTVFENGDRRVLVTNFNTGGILSDTSQLFELGQYYTVIPYRTSGGQYAVLNLRDVPTQVLDTQAQIRVVNVGDRTVDVYIHSAGSSIQPTDIPTIDDLTQGDSRQDYTVPRPAGSYTLTITDNNNQTVLYERNIVVHEGEVETAIVTGNTSTSTSSIIDLPSHRF